MPNHDVHLVLNTVCTKEFAEIQAAHLRVCRYCPKLVGKALKPWPPRPLVKTWGAAARVTPLWMVTAPWMQQWVIRSEDPVKWGTFRDCKGWDGCLVKVIQGHLFNIQSDPCESSATREDKVVSKFPL